MSGQRTRQSFPLVELFLFVMTVSISLGACQKKEETKPATAAAAAKSAVVVNVSNDGITAATPAAEFRLTPSGALTGSIVGARGQASLEDKLPDLSPIVSSSKREHAGAHFDLTTAKVMDAAGKLGALGKHIEITGAIQETNLTETLDLEIYDDFPNIALLSLIIRNAGQTDVALDWVTLQRHEFASAPGAGDHANPLWTFQGASLKWGKDEIFAMPAKFSQENPFGAPVATKDDLGYVGGGIPVVAFWNREAGEAIGHVETLPLTLSIPVKTTATGKVETGVRVPADTVLKPGEVFSTPRTFLAVYRGDFYLPLSLWSKVLAKEGLEKPRNNDENYAVSWCGWGYEFGVTPKQMLDTIPKLKELGIHWATLDDGWFNNYGDWQPNSAAFKEGTIPDMVKKFHDQGMKMQVWWLPLGVEDGHFGYGGRKYVVSEVVKEHPDWLILDKNGKPARMARNLATLCPAVPGVKEYYKVVTERFIRDWGFDGHKLDNIWSTPMCYNPKHHHKSPYDSVYAMGDVYKVIFETTRALKPDSVTQSCPCGTPPNLAWLRYMDQAVTADPVGSIQVRRRVKMYKALLGPEAAVYGDHVELTRISNASGNNEQDLGEDFASTLGTGGVLGTKFTWPDYGAKFKTVYLNQEKESHWKEWISLYNEKMLSKGNFLDLYVYGFDSPEAYAIEKDHHFYYAFYSPDKAAGAKTDHAKPGNWTGEVELRGLPAGTFRVTDYVHRTELGTVSGPVGKLHVDFTGSLLLEAAPAH
ncbi:MAG TPA: glycoside hydrolase family 36 protein [Candidatus Limnocylindrales bacterium]|nr:glycoside hydrolase family 36 protein [Candidatus Limnocylindrales bacterium]